MSREQRNFLKKLRQKKLLIFLIQIAIVILFFVLWELLANFHIINEFIFSKPSKVITTIGSLIATNNLFNHIFTTIYEIIIAFSLGIVLGFIIAIILYEFPTLAKICDPFLTMLNSLPKVALGPLIIIIAGANIKSVIIMALLINLIVSVITIYNGFNGIDPNKIKLLDSLKATKRQKLTKLIIPASYQTIISSLKLNISMSQIGVVMGEFLVSKEGLGYLIIYGTQVFNLSLVMSGILILIIISFILYKLVVYLEHILLKDKS